MTEEIAFQMFVVALATNVFMKFFDNFCWFSFYFLRPVCWYVVLRSKEKKRIYRREDLEND